MPAEVAGRHSHVGFLLGAGLLRKDADGATRAVPTEERALRPTQNFDALDVELHRHDAAAQVLDVLLARLEEGRMAHLQGDSAASRAAFEAAGRILVVAPGRDEKLQLSARNLPRVDVILADSLNVVDLLNADTVVIEQPALARMEEVYA